MPHFKPTLKLDLPGDFGLHPEQSPDYFIESQQQEKLFVKPPNWCSPGSGVELLALQNERDHVQMLQLQHDMLENAKRQRITNSNRFHEILAMQTEIRKRLIGANVFFKDCDDKKRLATATIAKEKQIHMEFKDSINTLKQNTNILFKFYEDLRKVVKELGPYGKVIEEVANVSNNCCSIEDCMKKCDALMMTQVEVCELQKNKLQEIENVRLQMIKLTNEAKLTVLGLNNELSELERAYSQVHSECARLENIIGSTKDCINEHKFNTNRIVDEISIMYRLLCRRRGLCPVLSKDDIELECDFIKSEIEILRDVINKCLQK
ncbi:uncharacterized protein LOC129945538 [Eupeodes corollae]|uniref:uncharacterized protein LOC129945538 n=1 Tax=Eupeodes corollae TaxID=290404 RepID=UPI0024929D76|nr:uncharacterized protein LOC129945538 [Eupeodes corollae]